MSSGSFTVKYSLWCGVTWNGYGSNWTKWIQNFSQLFKKGNSSLIVNFTENSEWSIFYNSSDSVDNHPLKLKSLPWRGSGESTWECQRKTHNIDKVIEISNFKCKNALGSREANRLTWESGEIRKDSCNPLINLSL